MILFGDERNADRVFQTARNEAKKWKRFSLEVNKYEEKRVLSDRQRNYIWAVPVTALSEYSGISRLEAEIQLKIKCGYEWLVHDFENYKVIGSLSELTVEQGAKFIENVLDYMAGIKCPVPPPDPLYYLTKG